MSRSAPLRWRAGARLRAVPRVATLLAFALLADCNDPQSPAPAPGSGPTDFRGGYDAGGGVEFGVETPGGDLSVLRLVASGVTYDVSTQQLHVQVAIRNPSDTAVRGPSAVALADFDPQTVHPVNIPQGPCPACIPCPCWPWSYAYDGTYGDDGLLSPGETSSPVEWIVADPSGDSFAFRARLVGDATAAPGTISGSVFADADGDGRRQPGEPGIPGATVNLIREDAVTVATTDADGRYQFTVSEPGLYDVMRAATNDCEPTTPLHRSVLIVQRTDGSLSGFDHADFGCGGGPRGGIWVIGIVFDDSNRDGHHQPGEPGLANVLVTGATERCPTFAAIVTRTDERGLYRLNLPGCPPPYVIGHETLPGFADTSPNPLVFGDGTVPPDSTPPPGPQPPPRPGTDPSLPPLPRDPPIRLLHADFGMAVADSGESALITGLVYRDTNRNGMADPGEPGIPDVGVNAGSLQCAAPFTAVRTDANGRYTLPFADIHCPSPWVVQREVLDGLCDTSPNPFYLAFGANGEPVPVHAVFHVDFGSAVCDSTTSPVALVEGNVFADLNRNGSRDRGEPGVPGATLQLVSPCEAIWEATTDARGHYLFRVVPCPVRGVALVRPEFPEYTTPNPALLGGLVPGQATRIDFGVVLRVPPPR